MKIVHSFWTKPWKKYLQTPKSLRSNVTLTAPNTGWADIETMLTVMHWSCHQAMSLYGEENLVLITDSEGAELLKEKFRLPYGTVLTVLDEIQDVDPAFWGYEKVVARSHMQEPFWHIDIDWIFNKSLPLEFESADFVVRSLEGDVCINSVLGESPGFGYTPIWSNYSQAYSLLGRAPYIPDCLKKHANLKISVNSGIFGGCNLDFIQECCSLAKQFVTHPGNSTLFGDLADLGYRLEIFNFIFEKAIPAALAMDKDISIHQVLPFKPYVDEGYNNLADDFKGMGIHHLMSAKAHKDVMAASVDDRYFAHRNLKSQVAGMIEEIDLELAKD